MFIAELAVRAIGLLGVAWLITIALRRRSASLRSLVWATALAGSLLLPIVSGLVPAWPVAVWTATSASTRVAPRRDEPAAAPGLVLSTTRSGSLDRVLDGPAPVDTIPSRMPDWSAVMIIGIALVAIALLFRIVLSHARVAGLSKAARGADVEWLELVDGMRARLGISRPVDVRLTDAMSVPAVTGLWRPVLLLPVDANDWAPEVRRAVVLHELAHVARRDPAAQLIGQVACAIYWFVPLAWYGARRAAALRERASDDVVLRAGVRPSAYAESLIALARSAAGSVPSPAALAMAQSSRLRERVVAILDPATRRDHVGWRTVAAVALGLGSVTATIGAVEPDTRMVSPSLPAVMTVTVDAPAATPRPPAQASPQSPDRLCAGRGLDSSSSSIQEDSGRRRWTIRLSGDGCKVDLRAEGRIEFTPDFTDISRIDANGFFRVDVTDRGVRRELDIESRGGSLTRTWRVDGRERPYDADARTWFAGFLIELDRRTAIGLEVRLPHLLRQGGVDGVLKETALMTSDHARSRYYTALPGATKLTSAETTRVLRQAASLTRSDHYASEVVSAFARPGVQDATLREALVAIVERMDSDHYRATSIETILGSGAPGPAEMDLLMRVVPRMESDHYRAQVLMNVLGGGAVSATHRVAIAQAAGSIGSDHYAAQVLDAFVKGGLGDEAVRRAFFDAAARIGSDHYRADVLGALLNAPAVTERDLLDAVASTKTLESDHYKGATLERIGRHRAATEYVRTSVLDAAAGLSRHYAEQVRRAVGR